MPSEKLITFDIHWPDQETTETYEATQGMTWDDWVSSEYNTRGFLINTRYDIVSLSSGRIEVGVKYDYSSFVDTTDVIIDKYRYIYN